MRLAKMLALRVAAFIMARPGLDLFLRRQLFRFPALAGRMRGAIARSRHSDSPSLPPPLADEAELSEPARQVLHELRRALDRSSTS